MSSIPIPPHAGANGRVNGAPIAADKTSRILSRAQSKRTARSGESPTRPLLAGNPENFPLIVHCHLCWDWVWQRPQQFLSRLSAQHKILFVETVGPDPQLAAPYARFRNADGFPNITLLRIQFPTGP